MHVRRVALPLLAGLLLFGCSSVSGSGVVKTESRPVSGFSAIEISGVGNLAIDQTGTESLSIEAEDNVLPVLTSEVSGGTLRLGTKSNTNLVNIKPINYRLTVKDLTGLTISGAATVTANKITTSQLRATISGSGSVTLGGSADSQNLTISGSGNYQAAALSSKVVNAQISGSGSADVMVSEILNVQISGSGSVRYGGDPKTVDKQISGSGELIKR